MSVSIAQELSLSFVAAPLLDTSSSVSIIPAQASATKRRAFFARFFFDSRRNTSDSRREQLSLPVAGGRKKLTKFCVLGSGKLSVRILLTAAIKRDP